jgi:hypothetical protein
LAIVVFSAVLAGCGTGGSEQRDGAASTERNSTVAAAHVNKCVELLAGRPGSAENEQDARVYIKDTYCVPFERNGWIYDDGALRIAAQEWLDKGSEEECVTGESGESTRTVPCDTATEIIDCALLHHVRRAEVIAYMAELQQDGSVQCDDGTPLAELGVP